MEPFSCGKVTLEIGTEMGARSRPRKYGEKSIK